MQCYKKLLFIISFVLLLNSCGSKGNLEFFSRQDVDMGYISRVAVLPFENNTQDKFAAERVRDMTITQTLASGLFDVVDKGVVDSGLREEAIDLSRNTLNVRELSRLGQLMKVEAFILGTVDQAGKVQRGAISYPQLSLTLRLIDVQSGVIIWQASGSENGQSYSKRLFGVSSDDDFKVALKLIRRLLHTIPGGSMKSDEADGNGVINGGQEDPSKKSGLDEGSEVFRDQG